MKYPCRDLCKVVVSKVCLGGNRCLLECLLCMVSSLAQVKGVVLPIVPT